MAATGQSAVWAVARNPSGRAVIRSVWLIQQTVLSGTSVNRAESAASMVSSVRPYSETDAGCTRPPKRWAMSWDP